MSFPIWRILKNMSKINVYLSKINPHLSQRVYNDLLQAISKENRERCHRFRRKESALSTLYGELMLRHVLIRKFALKNHEIEIYKDELGKPYIKDSKVHYNISHSGEFVVCAFSEQEVGIDIEQIKDIDLRVARRYFCESECKDLFTKAIMEQQDYFFTLWALKESYMKWSGRGMSIALDSFCFRISDDGVSVTDINSEITPYFKQIPFDGYKIALCSMIENFEVAMEEIHVDDFKFE